MQLLLRRRIHTPQINMKSKFILWAKFELTSEEARLINQYRASFGYLTIEQSRRDLYRAVFFSFLIALFGAGLMLPLHAPPTMAFIVFLITFGLAGWVIYEQIREAIRIGDMLDGREFKHKSLVLMARRERRMIGYAHVFILFLEKLKQWEGTEVIEIGEEHEPALRLVTDTYAPA